MAAPFFLLWHVHKKHALAWLLLGTCYGTLMGIARILQGGHFLSDILWSVGFVFLSGQILYLLMPKEVEVTEKNQYTDERY